MPIVSEEHREERKRIILDAAKQVFILNGFNATTMQDIINQSQVSRGGIYTYFQNTEDIFIELLKRRDIEDQIDVNLLYDGVKSNWQVLLFILDQIEYSIEHQVDQLVPSIYEYYFTIAHQSKKHLPSLEARMEQAKNIFASIIRRGIEEKEFHSSVLIEDTARTIITFCDGIYISCFHLGAEKIFLKNQFKTFKNYLKLCLLPT